MKVIKTQQAQLLVLERGEFLMEKLHQYVEENQILGGTFTGLGALKNVELGFYQLEKKDYKRLKLTESDYELVALSGNISLKEGQAYVHIHVALGDEEFRLHGGHLFEAQVAVTAEITLFPLGVLPVRQLSSDIGLAVIHSSCPGYL